MNNRVLIPVDKKLKSYQKFMAVFKPVIEHWKLPYAFTDVEEKGFVYEAKDCGLILLLQPEIGVRLKRQGMDAIADALKSGTGLFVAESGFLRNSLLRRYGFAKDFPKVSGKFPIDRLEVSDNRHFIAATKEPGEIIRLPASVDILSVTNKKGTYSTVVAHKRDKIIFFLKDNGLRIGFSMISSPSLVYKMGFGTDIDVFYWKSIIYLARKPIAQILPPRFVTFRIEDSIGEGDYAYLDFLVKQGFKVHLGLDINDFNEKYAVKLQRYQKAGAVEFSPHAFTHYKKCHAKDTMLVYSRFDGSEYSAGAIKENMAKVAAFAKNIGIKFSSVLTYHYCQIGKNALPYLKRMGVRYLAFPFGTNTRLEDALKKKRNLNPFGKLNFVADRLPGEKDFFVISALEFPHKPLGKGKTMNVGITSRLDFLYGLRLKAPGRMFTQYNEAARKVCCHVRRAFENMFFGTIFTHETLINYLKLKEFKKTAVIIKERLKAFGALNESYANIAQYYYGRFRTRLLDCRVIKNRVLIKVSGKKAGYIPITVYKEKKGEAGVIYKIIRVPKAQGTIKVKIAKV